MKKILLISNKVMHYRSNIYNEFFSIFEREGYEFHVISNDYQSVDFDIIYKKHQLDFSVSSYTKFIDTLKPDICINFLHLKDKLIIPLTLHCRRKKIPMIYWNHGINIKTPNSKLKNLIFYFVHYISSAIILYSEDQLKYIWKCCKNKTFIAHNTLNFSNTKKNLYCNKELIKKGYGIKEEKVLLYISRILPYKGLDVLLNNFANINKLALVVVGGGISEEQKLKIKRTSNFYYLGELYGGDVNKIYSIGDFFSTPGHIGLALNQAMFWGIPVFVLNRIHAPEICYLHNGYNGFILDSEQDLKNKILSLIDDEKALKMLSQHAYETFENEMQLSNMFQGFLQAIEYVKNNELL